MCNGLWRSEPLTGHVYVHLRANRLCFCWLMPLANIVRLFAPHDYLQPNLQKTKPIQPKHCRHHNNHANNSANRMQMKAKQKNGQGAPIRSILRWSPGPILRLFHPQLIPVANHFTSLESFGLQGSAPPLSCYEGTAINRVLS